MRRARSHIDRAQAPGAGFPPGEGPPGKPRDAPDVRGRGTGTACAPVDAWAAVRQRRVGNEAVVRSGRAGAAGVSPRHTKGRVVRRRNPAPLTGSMSSLCHEKGRDVPKRATLAFRSGNVLLCSKICRFLRGPSSHDEGLTQKYGRKPGSGCLPAGAQLFGVSRRRVEVAPAR